MTKHATEIPADADYYAVEAIRAKDMQRVEVGDLMVRVSEKRNSVSRSVVTVERLTKTQVIASGERFHRSNGSRITKTSRFNIGAPSVSIRFPAADELAAIANERAAERKAKAAADRKVAEARAEKPEGLIFKLAKRIERENRETISEDRDLLSLAFQLDRWGREIEQNRSSLRRLAVSVKESMERMVHDIDKGYEIYSAPTNDGDLAAAVAKLRSSLEAGNAMLYTVARFYGLEVKDLKPVTADDLL